MAATANRWTNENILDLFPTHLSGIALSWFQNYRSRVPALDWNALKTEFITAFTPIALADNLNSIMERKIQGANEPSLNFLVDIITTCKRCKPGIADTDIIAFVIQGLKPEICKYITTLQNTTLHELEQNLRKAENYVISTTRNQEKYAREQTRFNTTENTRDKEYQFPSNNEDKYANEIHNLKTLVAKLEMTVNNNKSRDRSTTPDRTRHRYGRSQERYSPHPRTERNGSRDPSRQRRYEEKRYEHSSRSRDNSQNRSEHRFQNYHQNSYHNRGSPNRDSMRRQYYENRRHTPRVTFEPPRTISRFCDYCRTTTHNTDKCWSFPKQNGTNRREERTYWNNDRPRINCFYCNKSGHFATECRKKMADMNRNQTTRPKNSENRGGP